MGTHERIVATDYLLCWDYKQRTLGSAARAINVLLAFLRGYVTCGYSEVEEYTYKVVVILVMVDARYSTSIEASIIAHIRTLPCRYWSTAELLA